VKQPAMEPAQLQLMQEFLQMRGGDAWPGDDTDGEQVPGEGEPPEPDVGDALLEPVWKTEVESECPLKVLQACQLIAEYKERHRSTLPALQDLLLLLQALLPRSNRMPKSVYMFRQVSRRVLDRTLEGPNFKRLQICSDPECPHVYTDSTSRECPLCKKPRFHKPENGPERPIRELRYMGVTNGVRTLLMSKKVGRSVQAFDLSGAMNSAHSMYASGLSEHLCREFIPGYDTMGLAARTCLLYTSDAADE
jgi:hypothetical protein